MVKPNATPCLFLSHSGADTDAARELKRPKSERTDAIEWRCRSGAEGDRVAFTDLLDFDQRQFLEIGILLAGEEFVDAAYHRRLQPCAIGRFFQLERVPLADCFAHSPRIIMATEKRQGSALGARIDVDELDPAIVTGLVHEAGHE